MNTTFTPPIAVQMQRPSFWSHQVNRGFLLSGLTLLGVVGGFLAKGYGLDWLQNSLWTLAFLAGGIPAAHKAILSLLQQRKLDVDLLMVVAALGAPQWAGRGMGPSCFFCSAFPTPCKAGP